MSNVKENIILSIVVIFIGLCFAGGTYAYLTSGVNLTNENHTANTMCFLIDYSINDVDGTQDITGTLFPSANASSGLNGRVDLKINDNCNMYGTGTLKLHVNSGTNATLTSSISSYCQSRKTLEKIDGITTESACTTANGRWMGYGDNYCENPNTLERLKDYKTSSDCTSNGGSWTSGGSPLKYAVYDTNNTLVSVGHITSNDIGKDIVLKDNISVIDEQKYFYIYVWLDGYLTDNTFNDLPFSGYISADATQRENQVPNEYQQVEYLQSTGTQYIITNIIPSNETGVYAKLSSSNITKDLIYFGSAQASEENNYNRFWVGNNTNSLYFGWGGILTPRQYIQKDELLSIKLNYLNDRKSFLNDNNINSDIAIYSGNLYPISIFAGNRSGTVDYFSQINLYEFKVSENNKIVRDFIPCKNGNVAGLYDLVEDKFYTNSGSGTFEVGPEV